MCVDGRFLESIGGDWIVFQPFKVSEILMARVRMRHAPQCMFCELQRSVIIVRMCLNACFCESQREASSSHVPQCMFCESQRSASFACASTMHVLRVPAKHPHAFVSASAMGAGGNAKAFGVAFAFAFAFAAAFSKAFCAFSNSRRDFWRTLFCSLRRVSKRREAAMMWCFFFV